MKIAVNLIPYTTYQGIETYTRNLILSLQKTPDIEIILIKHSKSPKFLDLSGSNIKNFTIAIKKRKRGKLAILQQTKLFFILKKTNPDFLLCTSPAAPIFYRKSIITIHDCAYDRFPEFTSLISKVYFKVMYYNAKIFSRMILTDSEFSKSELIKRYHIKPEKIKVVYLALPKLPAQKNNALNHFKLKNKKYFIYVGNTRPRKNIGGLLRSFKIFLSSHPSYKLVIAGRIDDRFVNLKAIIKELGLNNNVILTDFIKDSEKVNLIKHSAAHTFPSYYEGFGLPILEAQSLGVPVLTSNTSSIPEVAGKGALYIDPCNVQDIARGMEQIVTDTKLRKELIEEGHKNVKRFSWEKTAKELADILEELKNEDS